MGQLLLTDCRIIADSHKSYEKASLHIVDDKIENIYFNKHKPLDTEEISLSGLTVMPDIFLNEIEKSKLKDLKNIRHLYRDASISTLIDDVGSEEYILCDADRYDDKFLNFAMKVIDRDKLIILCSDVTKILKAAFDYNDALSYLILNAYRALDYPVNMGKLWRGAKADFVVVNNGDIVSQYREGRLVR